MKFFIVYMSNIVNNKTINIVFKLNDFFQLHVANMEVSKTAVPQRTFNRGNKHV